ncbi:MAG: CoA-transferase [Anaerolineales bacterium]|nr:CoA-transferase [Anaerolineales bacterium]
MDKTVSLSETAALIPAGSTIALGGMTLYRRPLAFTRTLLRENPTACDLTLLCFTAGIESDMLVGAGRVRSVRSCYFGLEAFGLAPMFTQAAGDGTIEIIEESEASIAFGIRAALADVGFMPSRAWMGTDLPRLRPDVQTIKDPYSDDELMAFPAIHCDVAVIHALRADRAGNAVIGGNRGMDPELALLSETTLITTEELVDRLDKADIPGPVVQAVALAPQGALPTSCHPLYSLDGDAILEYIQRCKAGEFEQYLQEALAT